MSILEAQSDVLVLFTSLIQGMVDDPNAVKVWVSKTGSGSATMHVRVGARDVGKLIGLNGRTARALRVLLIAMAKPRNESYVLDLDANSPPA